MPNLSYPRYYKSPSYHVKVISKKLSFWVSEDKIEVEKVDMRDYIESANYGPSNETEFLKAYDKTSEYLHNLAKN